MASAICQDAEDCEIGGAGGLCIFSSILWLIAGVTTLFVKPRAPRMPSTLPAAPSAVTYARTAPPQVPTTIRETTTITEKPDGTTTTTTRVAQLDQNGREIVSETTDVDPKFSIS